MDWTTIFERSADMLGEFDRAPVPIGGDMAAYGDRHVLLTELYALTAHLAHGTMAAGPGTAGADQIESLLAAAQADGLSKSELGKAVEAVRAILGIATTDPLDVERRQSPRSFSAHKYAPPVAAG